MILVSACLLGVPCRMDGESKPNAGIIDLMRSHSLCPICPEIMGGMATPRIPSERIGDRVINSEGEDNTAYFRKGAERAYARCMQCGCTCAILKAKSPSCGVGSIYDGHFSHTLIQGNGILGELLLQNHFPVCTEQDNYLQMVETFDTLCS